MRMLQCKIFEAFGKEQLERMINDWLRQGTKDYGGADDPGESRFIFHVSYQTDGVFDRALVIYEDEEVWWVNHDH